MTGNNRYRYASELSEFINSLTDKYNLRNSTIPTTMTFEKHLVDRLLDRAITKVHLSTMITRLIKFRLCELLFLHTLDPSKRVDLWFEGYILGCSVTKFEGGEFTRYNIKLRTIFKASNTRNQLDNYFKINLGETND